MPSNSFILKGTTPNAGNGYWTASGGTVGSLTLASGVNFMFESFADRPGQVRLTFKGTWSMSSSAAGIMVFNCIIPLSVLPVWARPMKVTAGSVYGGSVGVGGFLGTPIPGQLTTTNVASDSTNMLITVYGQATAASGSVSMPVSTTMTYLSS